MCLRKDINNNSKDDEPRPRNFRGRESFQGEVEMRTIAFCYNSGLDLTASYCFRKADLQSAQMDHDFLERPFLECWVDNGNSITQAAAQKLEQETRCRLSVEKM